MERSKQDIMAEAMYLHRWGHSAGLRVEYDWETFKRKKPDIAAIYVENAEVMLKALERAP